MAALCIIHRAEIIKIHVLTPFLSMPDLADDAVCGNFWVNVDVLSRLGIGPVLKKV